MRRDEMRSRSMQKNFCFVLHHFVLFWRKHQLSDIGEMEMTTDGHARWFMDSKWGNMTGGFTFLADAVCQLNPPKCRH